MSTITDSPAWKTLSAQARAAETLVLSNLFASEPDRVKRMSAQTGALFLDYSKQRLSLQTMEALLALAKERDVAGWRAKMLAGEPINTSEGRAVLHTALRSGERAEVREARKRLAEFVASIKEARLLGATGRPIRDVVNLGIGGSDLGPRMVVQALRRVASGQPRVHFAANIDPAELDAVLARLDPHTTLFIICSKTFTTAETLDNARRAEAWLSAVGAPSAVRERHFVAVTANVKAAQQMNIPERHIFPFWDWVGGRYSVWSAVGLGAELAIGTNAFEAMLEGAHEMDEHFASAPLGHNLPVLLGLISTWNVNFLGARSHAILPYSDDLKEFPAYLQQLEMESNGKRVDRDGKPVDYATAPVLWGSTGTVSQHSFHQLLHQGTTFVPVDFIVPLRGEGDEQSHSQLVANAFAQASALMIGTEPGLPEHAVCPGNRPSTTLLLDSVTPSSLGQLIALYEHKVFVQGILWNINSFDQWGVELGKKIARALEKGAGAAADPSTAALLERARRR